MKRWVFNLLAVVSLVLCIATVMLWVRSYRIGDIFDYVKLDSPGWTFSAHDLRSDNGKIRFERTQWSFKKAGLAEKFAWDYSDVFREGFHYNSGPLLPGPFSMSLRWHFLGFGFRGYGPQLQISHFGIDHGSQYISDLVIQIPDWFIVGLTAVLPLIALWMRLKERKLAWEGLCFVCGYDLRATPERCPECGTAASKDEPISK